VERARAKLEHTALATAFCADTFTISELQAVYEVVWSVRLDQRNFYRKVQAVAGFIVPAPSGRRPTAGRPLHSGLRRRECSERRSFAEILEPHSHDLDVLACLVAGAPMSGWGLLGQAFCGSALAPLDDDQT